MELFYSANQTWLLNVRPKIFLLNKKENLFTCEKRQRKKPLNVD